MLSGLPFSYLEQIKALFFKLLDDFSSLYDTFPADKAGYFTYFRCFFPSLQYLSGR